MKCPNCGASSERRSRHCSYCGTPLSAPARERPEININIRTEHAYVPQEKFSRKNRVVALVLCLFLGIWGAHKFYLGKIGVGVVYIFTYGLFGIGWLIDLVTLIAGNPCDKQGLRLKWR